MAGSPHIIHRLVVEVQAPSEPMAQRLRDAMPGILKNDILPEIEKYLDSLDTGEEIFRISDLRIDIGAMPEERLEPDFGQKVLESFRQVTAGIPALAKEPGDSFRISVPSRFYPEKDDLPAEVVTVSKITPSGEILEAFLHFLETGRLPWNISVVRESLSEEKILESVRVNPGGAAGMILALIKEDLIARERLTAQFSGIFLEQFVALFSDERVFSWLQAIYEQVEKIFSRSYLPVEEVRRIFWGPVAMVFFSDPGIRSPEFFHAVMDRIMAMINNRPDLRSFAESASRIRYSEETLPRNAPGIKPGKVISEISPAEIPGKAEEPLPSLQEKKLAKAFAKKDEGIFVGNAGLVLLHPYLKYFFMDFGMLEEDRFRDRKTQQKAVHLLHYLATREIYPPEYKLILEKFLCGFPVDEPLDRFMEITDEMKEECENLLRAVIKNWGRLKGTSPDGLREGFLQREGKLIPDPFQPRLIVEHKAQDVLLDYLPWGYSVVKLPWMERPLFVEWND